MQLQWCQDAVHSLQFQLCVSDLRSVYMYGFPQSNVYRHLYKRMCCRIKMFELLHLNACIVASKRMSCCI